MREQSARAQLYIEDADMNATFSGNVVEPSPGVSDRDEYDPAIGVDAAGVVHVSYFVVGGGLRTMHRATDGTWSSEEEISNPGFGMPAAHKLAVSADGSAVAVWLQQFAKRQALWASRYTPGSGWSTGAVIDDRPTAINDFQVGMDASGNALVVYHQDTLYWRWL